MEGKILESFLGKLEEKYGVWSKPTSKFGDTSYGKIAKDLSISSSQFSKLVYGTATEGMYIRTIDNVNRLIRREELLNERDQFLKQNQKLAQQFKRKLIYYGFTAFMIGAIAMYLYHFSLSKKKPETTIQNHPLQMYFEQEYDKAFDSPYLKEDNVQEYCPCSAYEGIWSLSNAFKLPLPGSRKPGLYYLAKEADLRLRCSNINAPYVEKGRAMIGYEYLISEIWVDTDHEPLIPKYFDINKMTYTPAFHTIDFEENPRFKRIAVLHAFNVNNFEIQSDSIVRRGEMTGRYVSDLDTKLAKIHEIDVKHIVQNVLGDLNKTNCESTYNPYCDPNTLVEGESSMSFDCIYTIEAENLGLGGGYPYTKEFRLEKQHYSDYLPCKCNPI